MAPFHYALDKLISVDVAPDARKRHNLFLIAFALWFKFALVCLSLCWFVLQHGDPRFPVYRNSVGPSLTATPQTLTHPCTPAPADRSARSPREAGPTHSPAGEPRARPPAPHSAAAAG